MSMGWLSTVPAPGCAALPDGERTLFHLLFAVTSLTQSPPGRARGARYSRTCKGAAVGHGLLRRSVNALGSSSKWPAKKAVTNVAVWLFADSTDTYVNGAPLVCLVSSPQPGQNPSVIPAMLVTDQWPPSTMSSL